MLNADFEQNIIYCKKCLYPSNHPLNISFNTAQICSGCLIHEEKDQYDWQSALHTLSNTISSYKNEYGYDCIIPVSGARDSYYIVHFVKYVLKLNPLLVSYNRHYNTGLGILHLERLRTRLGCDIISSTQAPVKLKELTQQTFARLGSIHWPYLAGSTVFPVQVAVRKKIPLIIWGAHQGIDQVGMFFHKDEIEMTRRYRKEHDLLGFEAEDLVDKSAELSEKNLSCFFYPTDKELNQVGVRGIYLNNYIFWDSKRQHEEMITQYGYQPFPLSRTFDSYNDIDCQYYMDVHDHIKDIKFGFSKVLDQACREIRLGRLSRQEAEKLVAYFENKPIAKLNSLMQWLDLSEKDFYHYLNPFRDSRVWQQDSTQWFKKITCTNQVKYTHDEIKNILFKLNFNTNHSQLTATYFQKPQLLLRGWASAQNEKIHE